MQLTQVSRRVDEMLSTETGTKGSVRSWLQRLLDLGTALGAILVLRGWSQSGLTIVDSQFMGHSS